MGRPGGKEPSPAKGSAGAGARGERSEGAADLAEIARANPALAAKAASALRAAGRGDLAEALEREALLWAIKLEKALPEEAAGRCLKAALGDPRAASRLIEAARSDPKALRRLRSGAAILSAEEAEGLESLLPNVLAGASPAQVARWPNLAEWLVRRGALGGKRLEAALSRAGKDLQWSPARAEAARRFGAGCLRADPKGCSKALGRGWESDGIFESLLRAPEFQRVAREGFRKAWGDPSLRPHLLRQALGAIAYAKDPSLAAALGAELAAVPREQARAALEEWARSGEESGGREKRERWPIEEGFLEAPCAGALPILALARRGLASAYGRGPERAAEAFWRAWAEAGGEEPSLLARPGKRGKELGGREPSPQDWLGASPPASGTRAFGVAKAASLAARMGALEAAGTLLKAYRADPKEAAGEAERLAASAALRGAAGKRLLEQMLVGSAAARAKGKQARPRSL